MDISSEEMRLGQSLRDPVLWGQSYLRNRDGSARDYWPHQVEDLRCEDRNIIHLDGRDSGKSISLTTDALHFAFTSRGAQSIVAAPHQGHLDTLIEEMEFQLDANPDLMNSIGITKYGKPKIYRKPYFRLEFTNGSIIYFRPAGAYGDAFRSLHVERVWVDEGAWLSEKAWKALRQCLKAGGKLRIYSTPNGLRDTTYYRLTSSTSSKCSGGHRGSIRTGVMIARPNCWSSTEAAIRPAGNMRSLANTGNHPTARSAWRT